MESPTSSKAELARMYLSKYVKFSKNAIARALYEDFPEVFKDSEHARSIVRSVTHANGKRGERYSDPEWEKEYEQLKEGLKLPVGEVDDTSPFLVPPNIERLLIVSDFQVPFHDERAMEIAFEYGYKHKCDAILMNGDQQDFYGISRFNPNIFKRRVPEEFDMMREILSWMRQRFSDIPIYWKDGNHEERWEKYLMSHAPALFGASDFELPVILKFGEHRVQYITDKRDIKFGKLFIYHGHEFGPSWMVPVNPARWLSLRAKGVSALCGHFHQVSEDSKNSADGSVLAWWSSGCLCQLRPKWKPHNDWMHGFTFVKRVSESGNFTLKNKKIIKYNLL